MLELHATYEVHPTDARRAREAYMSALATVASLVHRYRPLVQADVLVDAAADIVYLRDVDDDVVRSLGIDLVTQYAGCLQGTVWSVSITSREVSVWFEPDTLRST